MLEDAKLQLPERNFWSLVDQSSNQNEKGCWFWLGEKRPNGYGRFSYRNKYYTASRLAFEFTWGPIPLGVKVCHDCDETYCCHPLHFFLGTAADNSRDAQKKGRIAKGARSNNSVLLETEVIEIWYAKRDAKTRAKLAVRFSVSETSVQNIWIGKTWRALTETLTS